MHSLGQGVEQDYTKARQYYELAVKQGYVDAQYFLGGMYRQGQGVPQNYKKAVSYYKQAFEQGHAGAT